MQDIGFTVVLVNLPRCGCFFEVNVDKSSIQEHMGYIMFFLVEILITGNILILVFFLWRITVQPY
jgi:hypothetical protein